MARGTGGIIAGIITLVIGGTVYGVSNRDIVKNFSQETGMTQQQAEEYVNSISEDELASFHEIGSDFISEGQEIQNIANGIDCVNYTYEWESSALDCGQGKSQLITFAESEIALGNAYIVLSSDSANEADMNDVILKIDSVNQNYTLPIISNLLDRSDIDEAIKTNLYNKSLLKAALESK